MGWCRRTENTWCRSGMGIRCISEYTFKHTSLCSQQWRVCVNAHFSIHLNTTLPETASWCTIQCEVNSELAAWFAPMGTLLLHSKMRRISPVVQAVNTRAFIPLMYWFSNFLALDPTFQNYNLLEPTGSIINMMSWPRSNIIKQENF